MVNNKKTLSDYGYTNNIQKGQKIDHEEALIQAYIKELELQEQLFNIRKDFPDSYLQQKEYTIYYNQYNNAVNARIDCAENIILYKIDDIAKNYKLLAIQRIKKKKDIQRQQNKCRLSIAKGVGGLGCDGCVSEEECKEYAENMSDA